MTESRELNDFIQLLKDKNDIVDVVSSYLHVEQKGRGFWALCPFHNDRNPSMSINREGQFYHCFVCKAGGDVIKFVQEYESCSFFEAIEILAKRANLEVPILHNNSDKDIAQKKQTKEACQELCVFSAKFYNSNLFTQKGAYALEYLKDRGLTISTIKRFGFGLSFDWDGLPNAIKTDKKNLEQAVLAGIVTKKDDGGYFDSLAQRLIVPIFDINGNVIAFGGRTFSHDKNIAKYKNTSVTPLFDKSKTLYALNFAKKAKQAGNLDFIIIVEGYMDAVALHQYGYVQAVASMGTSLTIEQAKLIKRLVNTVYICYDGDAAGQNATLRGLDILKNQDLEVKVVTLPDGVDPDEYVQKYGNQQFDKLLSNALPLIDYKLENAKKSFYPQKKDKAAYTEFRRKYAEAALNILRPLSAVEQESYLLSICEDTGLATDFLRRQLNEGTTTTVSETTVVQQPQSVSALYKAAYFVLASKLTNKPFATEDRDILCEDSFLDKIFELVATSNQTQKKITIGDLYALQNSEREKEIIDGIAEVVFSETDVDKKVYLDCIELLEKKYYSTELEKLKLQYSAEIDTDKKRDILMKISVITQKINTKV